MEGPLIWCHLGKRGVLSRTVHPVKVEFCPVRRHDNDDHASLTLNTRIRINELS
jgi:hypothetical protein